MEEDLVAPPLSLRLGDVIYERAGAADAGDRAARVGKIERLVPDNIEKTGYDWLESGNSDHLERGTPVYAVEGYDPSFRVVARGDGGWTLYEVAANRGAEKTADLLDIRGETGLVSVGDIASSPGAGTDGLRRPGEVTAFVDAVLGAPLVRITADYSYVRTLTFGLKDGTESTCFYEPDSGELYLSEEAPFSGVVLPEGLRENLRWTR